MSKPVLFIFGCGYSGLALAKLLLATGDWEVIGTTRSADGAARLSKAGIEPLIWPASDPAPYLARATHLLMSVAPDAEGDPVLRGAGAEISKHAGQLAWAGYLSTTGVYGDQQGGWVDEDAPLTPATLRGAWRVAAEAAWQDLAARTGLKLHIFRLAGIYGPGRGPFEKVRNGTARRIIKPGQVFSRIHVEDIAAAIAASIARPNPGRIYNLCDDDPAPPEAVIAEAANLLGLPLPPAEDFASAEMTPMARSFYAESKRVRNDRIKDELGVRLRYRDYRAGLGALLQAEAVGEA